MNNQIWLQYGCNIYKKIPQNIPKVIIPIIYYATKKWKSSVTLEDNYQNIINVKNNTNQSVMYQYCNF